MTKGNAGMTKGNAGMTKGNAGMTVGRGDDYCSDTQILTGCNRRFSGGSLGGPLQGRLASRPYVPIPRCRNHRIKGPGVGRG